MKIRISLLFLALVSLAGCQTQPKQEIGDDTIENTKVNGVTLIHRHIIVPPTIFKPINSRFRVLYSASLMSRPGYDGKVIRQLVTGANYVALGEVDNSWIGLANDGQQELIGYAPANAVVRNDLYYKTVREQSRRLKVRKKSMCMNVDGDVRACKIGSNSSWILN